MATFRRISAFLLAAACCLPGAVRAEKVDAVEAVGEALEKAPGIPWYDSAEDAFRPVDVFPVEEVPETAENEPLRWGMEGLMPFGEILGWGLVGMFLVTMAALIVWAVLRMEGKPALNLGRRSAGPATADRMEDLPISLPQGETSLLEAARREYEAGNYGQAVVFLFSYQLLELDDHQLIRLTRGKTNRQYLRELAAHPRLRGLLAGTVDAFEAFFFGGRNLSREQFESCWRELDAFRGLVGGRT